MEMEALTKAYEGIFFVSILAGTVGTLQETKTFILCLIRILLSCLFCF